MAPRSYLFTRGRIYGQYLIDSKWTGKWEVENEKWVTQVLTRSPHADIFSKCFVLSPAITGICGDQWMLSGSHLFVTSVLDQVPSCALYFSSERLTGPKALFSGDASRFCELAMLQLMSSNPGPTPKASSTPPSERICKKFLSRQLAGVHRQLIFMSYVTVEDP